MRRLGWRPWLIVLAAAFGIGVCLFCADPFGPSIVSVGWVVDLDGPRNGSTPDEVDQWVAAHHYVDKFGYEGVDKFGYETNLNSGPGYPVTETAAQVYGPGAEKLGGVIMAYVPDAWDETLGWNVHLLLL